MAILKLFSASGYFLRPSCARPSSTQGTTSSGRELVTCNMRASASAYCVFLVAARAATIAVLTSEFFSGEWLELTAFKAAWTEGETVVARGCESTEESA